MSGNSEGTLIFKIMTEAEWNSAVAEGIFRGAPVDIADGYIHFSTSAQVAETAARHFRGRAGLIAIAFDAEAFGAGLRWEPSRGGDLFPHLHDGPLDPKLALWYRSLPLDDDGIPVVPDEILAC